MPESAYSRDAALPTPVQVRALRVRAGLTQIEFAKILWVSKRTIQTWESDPDMPDYRQCPALCWFAMLIIVANLR